MYLEISNRQTGKTTRLIDNVVEMILDKKRCMVTSINIQMAKDVEKRIKTKIIQRHEHLLNQYSFYDLGIDKPLGVEEYFRLVTCIDESQFHCKSRGLSFDRYYFDEIDFFSHLKFFDTGGLLMPVDVLDNGYFCTTSKKNRNYWKLLYSNPRIIDDLFELYLYYITTNSAESSKLLSNINGKQNVWELPGDLWVNRINELNPNNIKE